jgi:aspartate carbamoyltransferase regulatory subunit
VDAFLDEVNALLFFIEPNDFDFIALAVKFRALLETASQNKPVFQKEETSFVAQQCDRLQIKPLPGNARMIDNIITEFMEHADESRAVAKLVALYKQDAQDRAIAHINRIGERLGKRKLITVAVIVTKADKLSPFKQTSPRPTVLIPDRVKVSCKMRLKSNKP